MRVNSLIIDDFYNNPYEVREFALNEDFNVTGTFPGFRTKPFLNEDVKKSIGDIIRPFAGEITWWGGEYTGSFQYTTADDRSWIHSDSYTEWAGVLYLTPDAPLTAGTGIYRHKQTGLMTWDHEKNKDYDFGPNSPIDAAKDITKWEQVDRYGNLFNRLVMYRADNFHISLDYFGNDINDGRLFQVFFFNTEK
tara:strand:+ start:2066 stop:2644 length:579 start_codon:yes stop_codon:yes gene_type:complete